MTRGTAINLIMILIFLWGTCCCRHQELEQKPEQPEKLSPAVKAAILAAINPSQNNTDSDLAVYLRTARLESRTKQDQDVVVLFDNVVALAKTSTAYESEANRCRKEAALFAHDTEMPDAKQYARKWASRAEHYEQEHQKSGEQINTLLQELRGQVN